MALVGPLAANQAELLGSWKAFGLPNDVVSVQQGLKNKWNDKVVVNYAKGCDFAGEDTSGFDEAVKSGSRKRCDHCCYGRKGTYEW